MKDELTQVLEILASFCRDVILIKENGARHLMMNPDFEEEIRKLEGLVSQEQLVEYLKKIDYAIYGLQKNLNVNLLVNSLFSDLKDWDYV